MSKEYENDLKLKLEQDSDMPLSPDSIVNLDLFDYKMSILLSNYNDEIKHEKDSEYITEKDYVRVMWDIFPKGMIVTGEAPLNVTGVVWKELNEEDISENNGLTIISSGNKNLDWDQIPNIDKGKIADHDHINFISSNEDSLNLSSFNILKQKVSNFERIEYKLKGKELNKHNFASGFRTKFWIVVDHVEPDINYYLNINSNSTSSNCCRPMPTEQEIVEMKRKLEEMGFIGDKDE